MPMELPVHLMLGASTWLQHNLPAFSSRHASSTLEMKPGHEGMYHYQSDLNQRVNEERFPLR